MVFKLIGYAYDRVTYEFDRARRVLPTAVRFGVCQLIDRVDDLKHQFDHWRGACDHTAVRGKAAKKTVRKAPKNRKTKRPNA